MATPAQMFTQNADLDVARRQQQHNLERAQQQNTVGAMLLDAVNQSANIKPTMKDENGNVVPNPAYQQAQEDRRKLLGQYVSLNSPEQHASFGQHLHGLIFGKPTDQKMTPALNPSTPEPQAAPATGAPGQPVPTSAETAPIHPMAAAPPDHPLHAITKGIKTLGEHLSAFANPLPPAEQPDKDLMAKYYRDPAEVAAERQMAIWGLRGENALQVAKERTKALMASLANRPPRMLSQTTIPDLLKQLELDPDQIIYGPNGQELTPAQLAEMPPGTIAREFKAGPNVFYALGDQNSKTINVNGEIVGIPSVGPINMAGPGQNTTPLGQATSTLPQVSAATDPFGTTTTTTRQTIVTPMSAGPNATAPTPPSEPVLVKRPVPSTAPNLAAVNARIAAGNAASPKLNKGKPVSANAPLPASLPSLDENGHIPAGVGNDLAREYANNLLDGMSAKDIPNPRARAVAEQLASKYGWQQGKFTPMQLGQLQVFQKELNSLRDPNSGFLAVYGSSAPKRALISTFLDSGAGHRQAGFFDELKKAIASGALSDQDQHFITMFNQTVGRIQALPQITRGGGRPTETAIARMMRELPYPDRVTSPKQAEDALSQIQDELDTALTKKEWGGGGPVSRNAPRVGKTNVPSDEEILKALKGK